MIKLINDDSDLLSICATGCEEGAMTVHYRWHKGHERVVRYA
jgi:hypothetical protein